MSAFHQPKVFVSATSRGLRSLRQAVAGRLHERGYEVVVQEEFGGDYQQIKDMIRDQLAPCDAVVLLVGPAYGFEPTGWPDPLPRRSYTQLEYDIAVELGIPVYRFLTADTFPLAPFDSEPTDHQQRQREYVTHLKAQDHIWYEFASESALLALLDKTRFHVRVRPNLPFASIGSLFKGRADELQAVRRSLLTRPAHATAVTSKQAIHGLGGVGKTRFAVEYAHRYRAEYSAVLYASADTPASLTANLAALAQVLHLPEAEEKEQAKQLEAVERWLRAHAGWLLILDNVDTVDAQAAVNAVFPKLASGHVLVTSRLTSGWADGVNAVELDTLSIPASTEFLLERTARDPAAPTKPARQTTPTDPADAKSLAEYLGGLALALEQAGAYIGQHGITFAGYQTRLKQVESKVLAWFDADVMKYPRSVAVTWQASVDELSDDGRTLLHLLCWLAPDPIPVSLIRTEPKEQPHAPIKSREKALRQLMDYSLAKGNADGGSVTVHRLVQDVTRARLTEPIRTGILQDTLWVLDAFCAGDPTDSRTWKGVYAPVSGHVWAATQPKETYTFLEPVGQLTKTLGRYFNAAAVYDRAEAAYRRSLAFSAARHGDSHPLVAVARTNLAGLLQATNRPKDAEAHIRLALAAFEQADPADPMVATALSHLAETLSATDRRGEAEPLMRRALAISESAFGTDHPQVAIRLNNLAGLLQATNRRGEAEPLLRRALAIDAAAFGTGHPQVALRRANLAEVLRAGARYADAEPLFRQALDGFEAAYGPDHPKVATALNGLAHLLCDTDRHREGEPHFRRVVTIFEATLGTGHPNVATALNNLAGALRGQDRHAEAIPLVRRALAIDEASYGSRHTNVATCLSNLADLLSTVGQHAEAEPLARRALEIDRVSYSPGHPQIAIALNNLGQVLRFTGRAAEAEPLLREAVEILERSLGPNHPSTQIIRGNYRRLLGELPGGGGPGTGGTPGRDRPAGPSGWKK